MAAPGQIGNRILLAVLLDVVSVCAFFSLHRNLPESFYATLAEADKDGAVTRGWIPGDILASGSRAIHVVGDLALSEWCAFEFSPTRLAQSSQESKEHRCATAIL
jgi:hypothetical protein